MQCEKIIFSGHAITRMFERGLKKNNIISVINCGQIIFEYPDDQPYPSKLMLDFIEQKPVHVVVARDNKNNYCYVVTAYTPSMLLWHNDYKTRRK